MSDGVNFVKSCRALCNYHIEKYDWIELNKQIEQQKVKGKWITGLGLKTCYRF